MKGVLRQDIITSTMELKEKEIDITIKDLNTKSQQIQKKIKDGKKEIITNMINKGRDINEIKEITGLTKKEIQKLTTK